MVPYVMSAVVAMTVMHVLLFVLHMCVLRECGGGVVVVSAYMRQLWVVHVVQVFCLVQVTCLR